MKQMEEWMKEKLAETPVTYDPAYWEDAAASMAEWERRRRRKWLIWLGLGGFLLLALSLTGSQFWFSSDRMNPARGMGEALAIPITASPESLFIPQPNTTDGKETSASHEPLALTTSVARNQSRANIDPTTTMPRAVVNAASLPSFPTRAILEDQPSLPSSKPAEMSIVTTLDKEQTILLAGGASSAAETSVEQTRSFASLRRISSFAGDAQSLHATPASLDATRLPFGKRFQIWLSAGNTRTMINQQGAETVSAAALQPTGGILIGYRLSPRLLLESGVQYRQSDGFGESALFSARRFDFVARDFEVQWQPNRLYQMDMPIRLQLALAPRHAVLAGVNLSYLLSTKGSWTTTETNPFGPSTTNTENVSGYVYGLSRLDPQLSLGYRLRLAEKVSLALHWQWGLMDRTDDTIFQAGINNRQRYGSISVNYRIK
ncbi:MAG: hypothetical protein AAF206_00885 [Bacteroidota bacterium]